MKKSLIILFIMIILLVGGVWAHYNNAINMITQKRTLSEFDMIASQRKWKFSRGVQGGGRTRTVEASSFLSLIGYFTIIKIEYDKNGEQINWTKKRIWDGP